jgi:signal transduction histidine kinase
VRRVLRSLLASLLAAQTYLRVVFLLVGAALALALGIVGFTVLSLVSQAGAPPWAVVLLGVVLVGGPLTVGVVPAVRQIEGVAVQTLLGVQFRDGPPGPAVSWPQRRRTWGWFLLHLITGALVAAGVIGLIGLAGSWWTPPAAVAVVLGTLLAGQVLARLAPFMLGPSYPERLARLAADAARASERNRLAREIHDSIGHALSLVTVQSAAARKLIGRDPAFAEEALGTIETTSRRAVADLDHMLGLLREDVPRGSQPRPAPDLSSLGGLLTAARSAGLTVEQTVPGELSQLPVLVSQEAYRIVQEGLTNALKYSADGTATLRISLDAGTLHIRLANPAHRHRAARAGRGLRGLDERAAVLGGTISAGENAGLWTLSAELPAWTPRR